LKSSLCIPASRAGTVRCRIIASAALRASAETIAQWRRQPLVVAGQALSLSFLKHSEDQTVVALQAILHTLTPQHSLSSFADWGVVAAPNFFGRACMAQTMERHRQEAAWGVSPHIIPHNSLHALSGTISQALKIYGPNFGISGGPNACADAFLLAAALLADGRLPGLWLVLSGHDAEFVPLPGGRSANTTNCQAVVMALAAADAREAGQYLSIGLMQTTGDQENSLSLLPEFQLSTLMEEGALGAEVPNGKWRLSETHWVEMETVVVEREVQA
jgi:hypothetical protein